MRVTFGCCCAFSAFRMTGVTDKQIEQLGIAKLTPLHPEDALKKAGAVYEWYAPTTDRGIGVVWGGVLMYSIADRPGRL